MSTVCKSTYAIQVLKHSQWKHCSVMKRFTKERFLRSWSSPKIPLQVHVVSYFQQGSQSNSARTCSAVCLGVQMCSLPTPMVMGTFSDQHHQHEGMQQQDNLTFHYLAQRKMKCECTSIPTKEDYKLQWGKKKQHWNAGKLTFFLIKKKSLK